jgi:hypothetical protein
MPFSRCKHAGCHHWTDHKFCKGHEEARHEVEEARYPTPAAQQRCLHEGCSRWAIGGHFCPLHGGGTRKMVEI